MASKNLKDLNGKWSMNKDLSSDPSPVLEIQGVNAMIRKAASMAPISLDVSQPSADEIHIKQSTTASIPAIDEEWYPGDYEWREQSDKLLGKVRSRSRWAKVDELGGFDAFLVKGLGGDDEVIQADVESRDGGWKAVQVWLFEGSGLFGGLLPLVGRRGRRRFWSMTSKAEEAGLIPASTT